MDLRRARLLIAFAALYLIWGSTYLAIRIGLETLPPFALAGTRFVAAGLALFAWARLGGAPAPRDKACRTSPGSCAGAARQ